MQILHGLSDRIERAFGAMQGGRFGVFRVALGCWAISTFLASPPFFSMTWQGMTHQSRAADYLRLCADPLARNLDEPILAYRLTMPLLAWLLHLAPLAALILPYFFHMGFLAVAFSAIRRRADPGIAAGLTLVLALSFTMFWSNWKPGFTDTTTHLLTACLLLTTAPHWTALALFFGLLNDERAILALPFVLLWHGTAESRTFHWRRSLLGWLAAVAGTILFYGLVRHALSVGWIGPGIESPKVYREMGESVWAIHPWLGSWPIWALNVFLSFRWAWALVLAFGVLLAMRREWFMLGMYSAAVAAGCLASALVADVARSIGYLFPAWLIAGIGLARMHEKGTRRWLALVVCALVVTPAFFTVEHFKVQWYRPLPLVIVRMATGWDLMR